MVYGTRAWQLLMCSNCPNSTAFVDKVDTSIEVWFHAMRAPGVRIPHLSEPAMPVKVSIGRLPCQRLK